jgi:hypothetical protein
MHHAKPHACVTFVLMVCGFALAPLSFSPAASNDELELAELMKVLSEVETSGGQFFERKYLSILSEPLTLKGNVLYRAPDYVEKEYDDPNGERYEVSGDRLTIELPDGRRRELTIDEHPVLRAFVESYRGTLAGDLETLKQYFDLELSGTIDEWRLLLVPKVAELTEYLTSVVMLGRGGAVYEVHTREAGGDYSVMTLEEPGE